MDEVRRWREAGEVLVQFGRADFADKWLLFRKADDTAYRGVFDSEAAATAFLGTDNTNPEEWEVVGPVEISAHAGFAWIDPAGDPHIQSLEFLPRGGGELDVKVTLGTGEVRRYPAEDSNWNLFYGRVTP